MKSDKGIEIKFLEDMIAHHQIGVIMAQDCLGKVNTKDITSLCRDIVAKQSAEIIEMKRWLRDWYGIDFNPSSKKTMSHMSSQTAAEYEAGWLKSMIAHHEAALSMSNDFLKQIPDNELHPELKGFAQQIINKQGVEIAKMRRFLLKEATMTDKPSEQIAEIKEGTIAVIGADVDTSFAVEAIKEKIAPVKTVLLSEALDLTEAKVDIENRTIKDVVLIRAGMSLNRNHYSAKTLQEAVDVFQNSNAYADHPRKADLKDPRGIRDTTGWYSNVKFQDGKLIADRHFTRTQAGNDVWEIAQDIATGRAPATLAGLSINAVGKGSKRKFEDGEGLDVESITGANSVDDVSQPSAKGGYLLTASVDGNEMTKSILEALDYEEWLLARPEFVYKLKREWKQVRLAEATQAAIAESDKKVKAALTETERANEALQEAQSENGTLTTANGKLMTEVTALRLEIAVNEALDGVQLPAVYIKDLRKDLPKLAPSEWVGKIETELSKAKRTSSEKVSVSGAGIQESKAFNLTTVHHVTENDYLPRDNEDIGAWQERVVRLKQNMR